MAKKKYADIVLYVSYAADHKPLTDFLKSIFRAEGVRIMETGKSGKRNLRSFYLSGFASAVAAKKLTKRISMAILAAGKTPSRASLETFSRGRSYSRRIAWK